MSTVRERTDELAALLRREHDSLAEFLVALARFDAERLWKALGHASLFDFLHRELGVSRGSAQYRKVAAELIRKCPEVVEPLRDGRICFTSVIELAKVATPENVREVLPRFFHRSRREAMDVVAELRPVETPALRTVVTPARASGPVVETAGSMKQARGRSTVERDDARLTMGHRGLWSQGGSDPDAASGDGEPHAITALALPAMPVSAAANTSAQRGQDPRTDSEPLTAELSRVHVTVPREFFALLEAARSALSHARPGASDGEILIEGLKAVVDRCARRRGIVKKPEQVARPEATPGAAREARGAPEADPTANPATSTPAEPAAPARRRREYIPAAIRRAVWERDGDRCSFPLASGGVCGSNYQLELDHVTPVALGGGSTVDDLRVACRAHNQDAARRVFGDGFVDACIRRRRAAG
jgi:hypothetical protein